MRERVQQVLHAHSFKPGIALAKAAAFAVIDAYWNCKSTLPVRPFAEPLAYIDPCGQTALRSLGQEIAQWDLAQASFAVGMVYTELLPMEYRATHGIYFTPPVLADKLVEMVDEQGIDWVHARVLDPACGGGAFLAPIAQKKIAALGSVEAAQVVSCLAETLTGYELDPFSGWMSQVFLDVVALPYMAPGTRLPCLVETQDTLKLGSGGQFYDLVIGNPPYARVVLSSDQRSQFKRSLFGHANLYGLFTDQALSFVRPGGCVAYVTPTSFLAGQYFKNLRGLISEKAPPQSMCMIANRAGIFGNVLQETMLSVYREGASVQPCQTQILEVLEGDGYSVQNVGRFNLPTDTRMPWLIPRDHADALLIDRLNQKTMRLHDYGYGIHTGPLVWNRHKEQLRSKAGERHFPLIWAESITRDGFAFRAQRKNHAPFFEVYPYQNHLLNTRPCLLLQRTTSKEQDRRLIAAELPSDFVKTHGAVVVENHINMIRAIGSRPQTSPKVLEALFNSKVLDTIFRCINGSVAVSAFELASLPMPDPKEMETLNGLVQKRERQPFIDEFLEDVYYDRVAAAQ